MKAIKGIFVVVLLIFALIMAVNFFPHEIEIAFNSVDVLEPIEEAAVYLDKHSATEVVKDSISASDATEKLFNRKLPQALDGHVPWTTKTIAFNYTSTVKLGIKNFTEISVDFDKEARVITVTLPEIEVLDNYVVLNDTDENNNPVNTISAADVMKFEEEQRAEAMERVKENGAYEAAAEHAKELITKQFNIACPDYTVEFA